MQPRRTTTRQLLIALIAGALLSTLAASPAAAADVVKPIVFPVDGTVSYTDTFGAPRSGGRTHEGQDLMGKKMMRLVAAVDGTVFRVVYDNLSAGGNSVTIKGADGWTYHYLHVNNDTPGTDDGKATRAQAFPANIVVGAKVTKGQLVGYMGDSGNAEGTGPHLHFEIRQPAPPGVYTGTAINPYASLQAATHVGATSVQPKWYLRTSPSTGGSNYTFAFGSDPGDRAVLCDWDGDGVDEPVNYRGGTWQLRNSPTDATIARTFAFGTGSDTPLCGDVDGDGADEPLLFRDGTWTVRHDFAATSATDLTVAYGTAGDRPVLGDWNGNGADDLGVYRGITWYLRSTGAASGSTSYRYDYGRTTDAPVAADWDGDGVDSPGIFRAGTWFPRATPASGSPSLASFTYGTAGDQPLTGEFYATTSTNIGVYRAGT